MAQNNNLNKKTYKGLNNKANKDLNNKIYKHNSLNNLNKIIMFKQWALLSKFLIKKLVLQSNKNPKTYN